MAGSENLCLCRTSEPRVIQGLLSLEDRKDHVFVHLVENAKFNRGRGKKYLGVAGNLFAFACKMAFENGYEGSVSFNSKTKLVNHYMQFLGAKRLFGTHLYFDPIVAYELVNKYFRQ